jgi:glutaconate CoA-transferase, subunit A
MMRSGTAETALKAGPRWAKMALLGGDSELDKRRSLEQMIGSLRPDSFIAFGGGGMQRKPMTVAKAIAASGLRGMRAAVFLGGPEVDLLAGTGVIGSLHFAYVGFDLFGLAPNFRRARENGRLAIVEYSEGTCIAAFDAGAKRLPFMPTRFGLGTDILKTPTSPFVVFNCPITGEELVAVPALVPDVAFIHVNEADYAGNGLIVGDAFIDPVIARSARKVFLTAERVVERLSADRPGRATVISRMWVEGVCEAPGATGFTGIYPDRPIDVGAVVEYMRNATDPTWLERFVRGERVTDG